MASPRPGAAPALPSALERPEDALAVRRRHARPLVGHDDPRRLLVMADLDLDRRADRRVHGGVLHEVRDHPVDLCVIVRHQRDQARGIDGDRSGAECRTQPPDHRVDQLGEILGALVDRERVRLQPRDVEQIGDQARQVVGLLFDGRQELGAVVVAVRRVGLAQRRDARLDRRERRAEVVRDRAQQGRLQRVGLPSHLGLVGPLGAAPGLDRKLGGDQRREDQQAQADRLVDAGHGEAAHRLDEEQIVSDGRGQRRGDARPDAPAGRGQGERQ